MISVHAWVYEDGNVNISIKVERWQNALGRRPKLTAAEKLALLSMIAEELDDRFPDMETECADSRTSRITAEGQQVAGLLTDRNGQADLSQDWDRTRDHPFVTERS